MLIMFFALWIFSLSQPENTKKYHAITPLIPAIIGISIRSKYDNLLRIQRAASSLLVGSPLTFNGLIFEVSIVNSVLVKSLLPPAACTGKNWIYQKESNKK